MSCGSVSSNYSSNLTPDGSATIACDGNGGYEAVLNGYEGSHCGVAQCVIEHENSHGEDWAERYGMCTGPRGSSPQLGGPGYDGFLQGSECRAYSREMDCLERTFQNSSPECRPYVQQHMESTLEGLENSCQASYP